MRMFSDADLNFFFIEGVSEGPVSDFTVEVEGDLISIYRPNLQIYEVRRVNFSQITDVNGNAFASAAFLNNYLQSQLSKNFPLRFTVNYPLILDTTVRQINLDPSYITDGGNF